MIERLEDAEDRKHLEELAPNLAAGPTGACGGLMARDQLEDVDLPSDGEVMVGIELPAEARQPIWMRSS